tara:strand:- start:237 stop:569 length:333 start_codon:yes stop_codon:yes gene_type:complete
MRQPEIFPLVVDQRYIEEYINIQNELVKWRKAAMKFRIHVHDWKEILRNAQSLKVKRKGTKISEIKIQSLINQAKEGLEENQHWLLQYEHNVEVCKEQIEMYSDYFMSKI